MRLSQALTLVGGPTDIAVLESARIIRGGLQNPQVVEADFRKLIEQGDQREDLPLQPNDLIVLPRSGVGNWNAFIAKIRPTLEVLTLPLTLPVQINALGR
jgi:protein involved in polysaccharide export with SLBB domain